MAEDLKAAYYHFHAALVPPTTPKSTKKTRFVDMSKLGSSSEDEESSTVLSSIKAGPSEECKLVYLNWSELHLDGPSDPIPLGTCSMIRSGNDERQDCGTMQVCWKWEENPGNSVSTTLPHTKGQSNEWGPA